MGFSRQEYWSGLPFPPPGEIPNPGIKLASPALAVKPLNIIWSYLLPSVGHAKKSPSYTEFEVITEAPRGQSCQFFRKHFLKQNNFKS